MRTAYTKTQLGEHLILMLEQNAKLQEENTLLKKENVSLRKEIEWWRDYGKYVSQVVRTIDAEACAYADGDEEYEENF